MKKWGYLCVVSGLVLAVTAVPAVNAQRMFGGGFGHGGGFGEFHGQVITGAPFSATRTVTHVETLTDGTTITHQETIKEARDSQGRIFTQALPSPAATEPRNSLVVHVFDPVGHTAITYLPDSKQATVVHLPDSNQFRGPRGPEGAEAGMQFRGHGNLPAPTVESLGSKTVNGILADGTRTTRVIPAGAQGNDKPITITRESWVSADLKVEVMRVETDPRKGTTTIELTGISRDEPPAALFQVPAGYEVNERTAAQPNDRAPLESEP